MAAFETKIVHSAFEDFSTCKAKAKLTLKIEAKIHKLTSI